MVDTALDPSVRPAATDLRGEMRQLCQLQSAAEIAAALRAMMQPFGDLHGVSHLETCRDGFVFLVDFAEERAAIQAANASGQRLFGFRTLVVDLRRICAIA